MFNEGSFWKLTPYAVPLRIKLVYVLFPRFLEHYF